MKRFWDPCWLAICLALGKTAAEWMWRNRHDAQMLEVGSSWVNSNIQWHVPDKRKRDRMILARNILGWYGNHHGCPGYEDAEVTAKFLLRLLLGFKRVR